MNRIPPAAILAVLASAGFALAADPQLPTFADVTEQAGIQFKHSHGDVKMDNIVKASGGGAMFFDYDGDGWLDIYLCNGRYNPEICSNRGRNLRGKLRNALYRNEHDGTFTDVTEQAGVAGNAFSFGCSSADFDNDGDLDLLVLSYGPDEFYRNNGDGTFTDISKQSGLDDPLWKSAQVTLYRSDGQVITKPLGIRKGDVVNLEGTKQTDRVVVHVSQVNGQTYKVADVLSDYRTR